MESRADASLTPKGRLSMVRWLEVENWTLARATGAPAAANAADKRVPDGNTYTSASMTPPAWPTLRFWPTKKAETAIGLWRRVISQYAGFGIKVERLMTDNDSACVSFTHTAACRVLGARHIRTRPYRPRTNGKAERFIRTMLGGWATERSMAASLAKRPPGALLAELNGNSVVGSCG